MLIFDEPEIRAAVSMAAAVTAVRAGFVALGEGRVQLGGTIHLDIPEAPGELHVKAAHVTGERLLVVKVAGGFPANRASSLPVGPGLMLALDASTGVPVALLRDNGWLTEVRTAAAGAIAADLLAHERLDKVAVVGSGVQARFQLRALLAVRTPRKIVIWGRSPQRAAACAAELAGELGVDVVAEPDLESAVRVADLVITVTPSREPLVRASWLAAGAQVTAVGSDGPHKRELDSAVLGRADVLVADSVEQCARLGELHHALADATIELQRVPAELGELVIGAKPGRTSDEQVTVCDLTGVGVQDWAITTLALSLLAPDGHERGAPAVGSTGSNA